VGWPVEAAGYTSRTEFYCPRSALKGLTFAWLEWPRTSGGPVSTNGRKNTFSWIVLRPKTALKFSLNNVKTISFSQVERIKCVKQKPHEQTVQTLGRIIIPSADSSFTVRLALPCQQLRAHRQARSLPAWWFWCHSFDNQSEITRVQVRYFLILNGRLRRGENCVLCFPSFFLWRYMNSALNLNTRVRSFLALGSW